MTKIVNSNSSVIETPTKNILIIGKTGNGKSTLANVLANTSSFAESSGSTSQTKSVQAQVFEHQQQAYQVIDTLGLSDTSLTEKEVLLKIAEIAEYLQDGNLCQVLFVIDKRISKEEREVYRLLQEVILADNDTKNLVTLVRSNFVGFEDQTAINQDLEHIKQQPALAEILTNSRDIIYLNNPSLDTSQRQSAQWVAQELREVSRNLVLDYLENIPNHQVQAISDIFNRVANYHSEQEQLQMVIADLQQEQQQLQRQNHSLLQQQNDLAGQYEVELNRLNQENHDNLFVLTAELNNRHRQQERQYQRKILDLEEMIDKNQAKQRQTNKQIKELSEDFTSLRIGGNKLETEFWSLRNTVEADWSFNYSIKQPFLIHKRFRGKDDIILCTIQ